MIPVQDYAFQCKNTPPGAAKSGGTFNGSTMTGLTAPEQGSYTDCVIGADDNVGNPGQITVCHSRDMSDHYTATIQ